MPAQTGIQKNLYIANLEVLFNLNISINNSLGTLMKVSELWLRSLIDPPHSIEKIAEQLTAAGIEVDSIEKCTTQGAEQNAASTSTSIPTQASTQTTVLTLKTPANRGDCLSMEGIAREVSALYNLPYHPVHFNLPVPKIVDFFPVHVESYPACPRYLGRIIQNINPNATTPSWMQSYLELAGIRSISPVVDVTNYVMLEMGQPLHAFDLFELDEEVVVRYARLGEKITTLDNTEISLREDTLIIADRHQPQAIAGIIGGLSSGVTEKTNNIFLECAYFDPKSIRFSARQYGLRTDSSIRFERGVDPNLQMRALERATSLLEKIVGGNVGPIIEKADPEALPISPTILLRRDRIEKLLGISIKDQEIKDILKRLEFSFISNENGFEVTVPSFRVDINLEEDLIEELIRVYGYQNIPASIPQAKFNFSVIPEAILPQSRIKQTLVNRGYFEAITYSFVSPDLIKLITNEAEPLILSNPISREMSAMRNSLWPGLIEVLLHNVRRQQERVRLFEAATCFFKLEDGNWQERKMLSGLCFGPIYKEQWGIQKRNVDFFDVKADVEALLSMTRLKSEFRPSLHPAVHPGQSADIFLEGDNLGWIAVLNPALSKSLDLPTQGNLLGLVGFEINLDLLQRRLVPKFQEFSKFPSIRRDIAIVVDKEVLVENIKSAIVKEAGPLLREVIIFDVYQGKGIEPTSKSIALGLILQHPSRTLVEAEVNEVFDRVVKCLKQEFKAILRE